MGEIDGLFVKVHRPSMKECGYNPPAYFSGHYMAHGLNMQKVSGCIVWFSLTWSLDEYEQLIRRVWRQGQRNKVHVYHIVTKGTVDMLVLKALTDKHTVQEELFEALK